MRRAQERSGWRCTGTQVGELLGLDSGIADWFSWVRDMVEKFKDDEFVVFSASVDNWTVILVMHPTDNEDHLGEPAGLQIALNRTKEWSRVWQLKTAMIPMLGKSTVGCQSAKEGVHCELELPEEDQVALLTDSIDVVKAATSAWGGYGVDAEYNWVE